MDLTALEFADRVCGRTNGPVAGSRIAGPVQMRNAVITDADWTNCVFDSSVDLRNCRIATGGGIVWGANSASPRIRCLSLAGSRITGSLLVSGTTVDCAQCRGSTPPQKSYVPSNLVQPERLVFEISLDSASIEGDLQLDGLQLVQGQAFGECVAAFSANRCKLGGNLVVESFGGHPLEFSQVQGSVARGSTIQGQFHALALSHSVCGGDLLIELSPIPIGVEDGEVRGVGPAIDLRHARVAGDVLVTSHHAAHDAWAVAGEDARREPDQEVEAASAGSRILVQLRAAKASIGKDFLVGRRRAEFGSGELRLELYEADLRNLVVGGELSISCARISGFFATKEDPHRAMGVSARGARAQSLTIECLDIFPELEGVPEGDSVLAFDLQNVRVARDLVVSDILGLLGAPDTVLHVNAAGVDLGHAECGDFLLARFDVRVSTPFAPPLGVSARGIDVSGDAYLAIVQAQAPAPSVDFSEGTIGCLSLEEPTPEGKIGLVATRVGRWGMSPKMQLGDQEDFETYRNLLRCADTLDVSQYVAVEKRLKDIGKAKDAEEMHVYWKRKERARLRGFSRFSSLLHDAFLGYGTKVWRPAMAIGVAFVLSVALCYSSYGSWFRISSSKLSELAGCGAPCSPRRDDYELSRTKLRILADAVSITTKNIVPIIDLELAPNIEAIPRSRGESWITLLKVIGYLLWPIFLTGLVANLLPQRSG